MSSFSRSVRPGESKIGNWIGLILIVVIGVGVGGFFLVRSVYRSYALSGYQASLKDYLAAKPNGAVFKQQMFKNGFMTIDASNDTIDYFFFDLPDKLKPANPAGVKTVVFMRWDKRQTGTYSNGSSAYTHFCNIDVVDLETKALIGQQQFVGGPPPQSIRSRSGSGEGSKPTDQINHYLSGNTIK